MSKFIKSLFGMSTKEDTQESSNIEEKSFGLANAQEKENKENSSKKLVNVEQVKGTPFTVVTNEQSAHIKKSFIAIGNNRITEYMTRKECMEKIKNKDWELIAQCIVSLSEKTTNVILKEKEVTIK